MPVGYKVMWLKFERSKPIAVENLLIGFLINDNKAQFGSL
jgi:hypothetical protein